jgi:hypothetical protein
MPEDSVTPFKIKEKIFDMMKYGNKALEQFPWRDRALADEIRKRMLRMLELTIRIEKKFYKKTTLQDLDIEIDILRHNIRLAHDPDYYNEQVPKRGRGGRIVKGLDGKAVMVKVQPPLPLRKYEQWSRLVDEIGRMVGGYIKTVRQ